MLSGSISLGRLAGAPSADPLERGPRRRPARRRAVRRDFGRRSPRPLVVVVVLRLDPRPRAGPRRSSPAATASPRRRSSCGRSAAWPASSASRPRPRRGLDRRRRTAGQPRPSAPSRSAPVFALDALGVAARPPADVRLARPRQRRPRHLQPAARLTARRRPHRAGRALGAARQPLPGDARGRPGRPVDRLGAQPRSVSCCSSRPGQRLLRAPHRHVRRHERQGRDHLRRHQPSASRASRSATSRGTAWPRPVTTWTPTR